MGSSSSKGSPVAADTKSVKQRNANTVKRHISVQNEKEAVPPVLVSLIRDKAISVSEGRNIATQTDSSDRVNVLNEAKFDGEIYDIEAGETIETNGRNDSTCNTPSRKTIRNEQSEFGTETTIDNTVDEQIIEKKTDTLKQTIITTKKVESKQMPAMSENDNTINRRHEDEMLDSDNIKDDGVASSEIETQYLPTSNTDQVTDIAINDTILERYGKYKVRVENDKEKCTISAVTFLDSGDLVLIDRSNHKIKFVDAEFRYISAQDLSGKPWAVCSTGVDVFVTIGNTRIQQLYVKDMLIEPKRSFEVKGRCLGMCMYGEYIAVGLQIGEVHLLNTMGEKHGVIQLPVLNKGKPCNPWHIHATQDGNLLVTDSDEGAVFCLNKESQVLFVFKEISSPRGTTIDSRGNIIVVGRDNDSGTVVKILSRDKQLLEMLHVEQQDATGSKSLLKWEDLEFVPYCTDCRDDDTIVLGGIRESLKIMKISKVGRR